MVYVISAHLANYNNTYLPTYTTTLTYIPIFEKKSQKFNIWPVLEPCLALYFFQANDDRDYTNEGNKSQLPVAKLGYGLKSKTKIFFWVEKNDHFFKNTKIKSKQEY